MEVGGEFLAAELAARDIGAGTQDAFRTHGVWERGEQGWNALSFVFLSESKLLLFEFSSGRKWDEG